MEEQRSDDIIRKITKRRLAGWLAGWPMVLLRSTDAVLSTAQGGEGGVLSGAFLRMEERMR
ncbi:hypothetical protein LY76DRAFT_594553 [Colletotrichum caudatum]|nr:hypothetical protein LY76DRAFT_594553 [Colletotrichum caudatum]